MTRDPMVRGPAPAHIALCASAVLAAGVWAFWPLGRTSEASAHEAEPAAPSTAPADHGPSDLRIAAFSAPLWVAPPAPLPPPAAIPEPPPPPPLKLQLLAVVNQDGFYEAVLFDPDADKLYTVKEGETLGARTVERVDSTGVDLKDSAGTRTLALKTGTTKGAKR